ncbi:polyphosphate kinase 1 [Spongiimicrobium salis]|uniref:polyphosphate kinase 1 n=1 Tax=Spongiimicrobium salis TaxID=1667022 RepID=UPI00374D3D0D
MGKTEVQKAYKYKSRDVDWINFNGRVLQEAMDQTNPLYERIKFLAIFSSNLDEFFKVRVSKLRQIRKVKKSIRKPLALKPNKTLKAVLEEVQLQQEKFGAIFKEHILPELSEKGIHLLEHDAYNEEQLQMLDVFFKKNIASELQPIHDTEISPETLEDSALYLVVTFKNTEKLVFIPIPSTSFDRFIALPSVEEGHYSYAYLEDVLKVNSQSLFPEDEIEAQYNIKISRDAELYLEDDYEGEWIQQIYQSLEKRDTGQSTRLLFEPEMPKAVQKKIRHLLDLGKIDMVLGGIHHNFSDFFGFPRLLENPELFYEPLPQLKQQVFEQANSIFDLIAVKDRILHFPYQHFSYLEQWVMQAAHDTEVLSIHISLYRVAKDSLLTTALLNALDNGKEVIIFVEAKARFDEENNLAWGQVFKERGGKVFYSFPNIKVHSKIMLIQRKSPGGTQGFAYIGTGNFNAKTAKLYCDHGLFTAHPQITTDLEQVFKVLRREIIVPKLKVLLVSPYNTRLQFEHCIQEEIDNANSGLHAEINIKMNSLEDKGMINWLYKASNAGVKIKLLVRGFCCLIPGIPGMSENIEVRSIVDRFLEHDRVFLFHHNGKEKMFMGSADWMTRNLDRRIEVLTPILDPDVFGELKDILQLQFSDNQKARRITKEGQNPYVEMNEGENPIRSQYAIYHYLKPFSE